MLDRYKLKMLASTAPGPTSRPRPRKLQLVGGRDLRQSSRSAFDRQRSLAVLSLSACLPPSRFDSELTQALEEAENEREQKDKVFQENSALGTEIYTLRHSLQVRKPTLFSFFFFVQRRDSQSFFFLLSQFVVSIDPQPSILVKCHPFYDLVSWLATDTRKSNNHVSTKQAM